MANKLIGDSKVTVKCYSCGERITLDGGSQDEQDIHAIGVWSLTRMCLDCNKKVEDSGLSSYVVACDFCGMNYYYSCLRTVEVINGTNNNIGFGKFRDICPFCLADREVETMWSEFMMPSYVRLLYLTSSIKKEVILRSMLNRALDKEYVEHRMSSFEGYKP